MALPAKCHIVSLLAVIQLFVFQAFADEIPKSLDNDKVRGEISKQIANLNVGFGFDFFNISETGFNSSLSYKYAVEPSYQDGFFSRFDRYPGKISINPIAWAFDDSHFGISVSASAELQFVRQFRDQKKAFTSMPYGPFKAPINANKAIDDLAVGDYASIIYRLGAYAGVGYGWSDFIKASVSAGHSLSSQYGAQVFRLRDNHIRLRLFAERSNGPGFNFGSKFDDDEFDLFSTDYLNDAIIKLIKMDLVEVREQRKKRAVYLADFVINLNNEQSRAAYDRVMDKMMDFKDRKYRTLNPFQSEEEIIAFLIEYTEELEQMYQEDIQQKAGVRRVTRIFLGKDILPTSSSGRFELGNAIFSFEKGHQFFDNRLTFLARNNDINRYNLPDATFYSGFKAFFSLWQESTSRSANALVKRSEDNKIEDLIDLGFMFEYKDKKLYPGETKQLKKQLCDILNDETCAKVDWSAYDKKKTNNFRMRAQYIFSREAFFELKKLNYHDYLRSIEETVMAQDYSALVGVDQSNYLDCIDYECDRLELHRYSMNSLASTLNKTFHSPTYEESYEAFIKLRWNPLFGAIGGRILLHMLPEENRGGYGVAIIELTGSNRPKVELIYSPSKNGKEKAKERRALYDYVKNIQTTIFNRGFDLRLQGVHGDLDYLNP